MPREERCDDGPRPMPPPTSGVAMSGMPGGAPMGYWPQQQQAQPMGGQVGAPAQGMGAPGADVQQQQQMSIAATGQQRPGMDHHPSMMQVCSLDVSHGRVLGSRPVHAAACCCSGGSFMEAWLRCRLFTTCKRNSSSRRYSSSSSSSSSSSRRSRNISNSSRRNSSSSSRCFSRGTDWRQRDGCQLQGEARWCFLFRQCVSENAPLKKLAGA